MYQSQLPSDPLALRQLAAARLARQNGSALALTDENRIRELQLQKCELELRVAELERVNSLLATAVDVSPDALFVKDAEGKYVLLNQAAVNFAGKPIEQLLGQDDRSLFDEHSAAEVMEHDRATRERGEAVAFEQTLFSGGKQRTYWTTKSPLFQDGQFAGVVGIARDVTAVRAAEAKLQESELQFRTLAENLPDGLYVLDPADAKVPLKILYANRAAAESDGYTAAEILGQSMSLMLDSPASAVSSTERQIRITAGEIIEFEVEHQHRLGHIVPYEVRAVAIPWEGRSAILGINRNTSVRKQAAETLRQSIGFQDALIRSIGQGVCVCYQTETFPFTRFTIWNEQMVELTGYTCEEINQLDFIQQLYPDRVDQQQALALLQRIWHDDVRGEEREITRKDGSKRTILISTSKLAGEANEVAVVATFTDITHQKQNELALRASEARYRTFVDHVSDGLFLHDANATVLDVNRQACESLGRTREQLIGQLPYVFDPAITPEQMEVLRQDLDRGQILCFETRHKRSDGSEFPVEVRVRPFTENGQRMSLALATDITHRQKIANELLASNERIRLVMRATNDAVWDWVPGTTDVWWSEGLNELFGYHHDSDRADPEWWLSHIHPDDRERVQQSFYTILHGTGLVWSGEYRFQRRDGTYVDVYDRGQIMRDETGHAVRMFGAMMDISTLKRAEADLRASERRFRDLADAIPQIVWTARPDGGLDHLNARSTQYTGLGLQDLSEWSWEQVIHPDDLPATLHDWGEILRTGIPKPLEFRIRRADGEYRWHITRQVASRDQSGNILHWYGTCTDIEDYKRVESALRESQQRFTEFMKHLPGLAWIKDLDGRYVFGNETTLKVFQVTTDGLMGRTDEDFFDSAVAEQFRRNDRLALEKGGAILCVETLTHDDGIVHSSLVSKFVIPGPDKSRTLIGGVAIDITSQSKVEEALRSSEERYRTLFHSIPDPMFVYDPSTLQYLAVNDAAVQKYGYSREEFLRMKITDLRPAEYIAPLLEMLKDSKPVFENRGFWKHCKKNGELIDVEVTAHSLQLDGKPACIVLAHDVTARQRAEAELRRTTELLKVVTDETPDAVFVKDREGRYLLFNPAAANFVGRTVEEVLGKDDTQLFAPADAAQIRNSDLRVMESAQTETNEEILTAAGVTRTYLATKGPYRDGNGEIVGTIGISRDITASKQAERLIKESQQRLQALFNHALNAIFLVTDEGTFVDANPAACTMLGFSREELLTTPISSILGIDKAPSSDSDYWEPFRRDGNQHGMLQLRRKNGATIDAEFSAVANVLPGLHLSVLSDVTERRQAEEAFRKVSAFHEKIIRTAVEGICLFTPTSDNLEATFSVWNDQMTSITGYSRDEINRLGWVQTVFRGLPNQFEAQQRFRRLLAGEVMQREELEVCRKDGDLRAISVSSSIIEADESAPVFVALMQDITDRRRSAEELAMRQAELRHASRLNSVGQLVAVIAHEVAQPLAAISNFAASSTALLSAESLDKPSICKHIDQINQQSRRAADIIRRLRDFSRKAPPQRKLCDLRELLNDSVDMLAHELRRDEVAIVWDWRAGIPAISADAIQLQQVFVNLLLNARDALLETPARTRRITLRSGSEQTHHFIDIEDNGVGLTEEVANRLFEPFVSTKPHGIGIGLSICRSIMHDHDGEISCQPLAKGGTRFRIQLASHVAEETRKN
ncbi:Sensor protein FixL [Anatilimnocola aggregata]|uniref:histidine kinase n=1 Tax=Anatilimnocola aggregata TaxID=2528021 RepID=A0A517YJL4_9BACT|nr:PAS domain S-box protein [Anatilimnocola aggregata]QDU30405.1 Sensor protein FixL [Anatilimnocola aggregata]